MTDTRSPDQEPEPTDDDALRKRLLGRVAVAGVIILGLLASLAIFDSLNAPEPAKVAATEPAKSTAPAAPADSTTAPNPAAPSPTSTAAASPTAATPEPATTSSAATPSATPTSATPTSAATTAPAPAPATPAPATAAPAVVAKATPEQTASPGAPPLVPLPPEKPLTKPATARQAMIRQSEPALILPPPMAVRPDPQREIARAPVGANRNAAPSRPLSQPAVSSQPVLTGNRQFALQLGVFNNLANAEELRARLELQGIPSTIEARVQVGPFKSREEVDAAREKLRALGMESGIMISLRK